MNNQMQSLSDKLKQIITAEIKLNNSIPFSRYMDLALYEKQYGYYNNLFNKFGEMGDFITAPTFSKLFGRTVAQQISELHSHGVTNDILEFGAGDGSLALDLLESIGEDIKKYYIFELSLNLIKIQQEKIAKLYPHYFNKVEWLGLLPESFSGIIIANEVLDAQPCEIIHWKKGKTFLQHVAIDNNEFILIDQNLPKEMQDIVNEIKIPQEDFISEINLNNRNFIQDLAKILVLGCILIVDYGTSQKEHYSLARSNGTVRGFIKHHLVHNILYAPGIIDITANVDFTSIATIGIDHSLDLIGYTTQGAFLLNCGILDLVGCGNLVLNNQLNKLTSPNEMGEAFKVIGFSKNIDFSSWCGFSAFDLTYTL